MYNFKLILKFMLVISLGTFAQTTITLQQGAENYSGCEDITVMNGGSGQGYMETTLKPDASIMSAARFTC